METLVPSTLKFQKDLLFKGQNCPQIKKQRILRLSHQQYSGSFDRKGITNGIKRNTGHLIPAQSLLTPPPNPSPRLAHAKQAPKTTNK